MGIVTSIATFIIVWWVMFFTVLPVGIEHSDVHEEGHDHGAPITVDLKKKIMINTLLTFVIWAAIQVSIEFDLIPFREFVQGV